jgi:proteasome lid subunit RPN8/RPN11
LAIPTPIWDEMVAHIAAEAPREACGLLGGKDNRVIVHYSIENEAHSTTRFSMQPQQQLQAFLSLDEQGLDLVAIYHSHPAGAAYPSETDLSEHAYPGVAHVILSPQGVRWHGGAFLLDHHEVERLSLRVVDA